MTAAFVLENLPLVLVGYVLPPLGVFAYLSLRWGAFRKT